MSCRYLICIPKYLIIFPHPVQPKQILYKIPNKNLKFKVSCDLLNVNICSDSTFVFDVWQVTWHIYKYFGHFRSKFQIFALVGRDREKLLNTYFGVHNKFQQLIIFHLSRLNEDFVTSPDTILSTVHWKISSSSKFHQ